MPTTEPTPESEADRLVTGIDSIAIKVTHTAIPKGTWWNALTVDGYVPVLRDAIAAAIRAAERRGVERAEQAVQRVEESYHPSCYSAVQACRMAAAAIARLKEGQP